MLESAFNVLSAKSQKSKMEMAYYGIIVRAIAANKLFIIKICGILFKKLLNSQSSSFTSAIKSACRVVGVPWSSAVIYKTNFRRYNATSIH
jgi:hypothetical protein